MAVTVLMPTYNCAEYISDAIKSILNQTYKDFEFLIIDDGSNDNTQEIVSLFYDERIRYVKKEHTGLSDSLNYGLKIAKNDLIVRMDADDISHPLRFEKQIKFLKMNPQIDILSCWYACFKNKNIRYQVKTPVSHNEIVKGFLLYSYINHGACLYNRNKILAYGGYEDGVFEDYKLWLKIMYKVEFRVLPFMLYYVRLRSESLTSYKTIEKYKIHYQIQQPYYDKITEYFDIRDEIEEICYRGWREFFFGDKRKSRVYWLKNSFTFFRDKKIFIAFILTFFPQKIHIWWKAKRFRYRLYYWLFILTKESREIIFEFNKTKENNS